MDTSISKNENHSENLSTNNVYQTPPFNHHEVMWLYQYDYNITPSQIDIIKALPRETLLKDLCTILTDAIELYDVYKQPSDENTWFAIHALLLMRDLEATECIEQILAFLNHEEEILDFYLGDYITEAIAHVITKCGLNNLPLLARFVKETKACVWGKIAVVEGISQGVLHKLIHRDDAIAWLDDLLRHYTATEPSEDENEEILFAGLTAMYLDLQAKEQTHFIQQFYEQNRVDLMFAGDWKAVETEMKEGKEGITHKIETITEDYLSLKKRDEDEYDYDEDDFYNFSAPIVRTEPKIGRNDPCPCGSGKKYKKCHGNS